MNMVVVPGNNGARRGSRTPWLVYAALAALLLLLTANAVAGYRNAKRLLAEAKAEARLDLLRQDIAERRSAGSEAGGAAVEEMRTEELALLRSRAETTQRGFLLNTSLFFIPSLAAALLVVLVGVLLQRFLSERAAAAALVVAQRELLKTTLSSIGDGVIVTDAQARVTFLNPVAERLTQWSLAQAQGQELPQVFKILNEETREAVENPALRALREGVVVGLVNHTVLVGRAGAERPIDDSAAPIKGRAGEILGAVLVFRDIAERRAVERELSRTREGFRTLVSQVTDYAIFMIDAGGRADSWNEGVGRLFGLSAAEFVGHDVAGLLYPADLEGADPPSAEWARALATGGSRSERWLLRKGGERFWASGTTTPLHDESGRHIGFTAVVRDQTERRKVDEEINRLFEQERARSERLRLVADAGSTLLASLSPDSVLGVVESQARAIIGSARAKVLAPDAVQPTEQDLAVALPGRGGKPLGVLILSEKVKGRFDQDDQAILTQLAQLAAIALENARLYEELREGDRRKDEFLATLAHELRNPLAPLRNAVEIMRLAPGDEQAVDQALTTMTRQTSHLVRLVDDLLDLSRISQGKIVLVKERVVLAELIAHAIETSHSTIEAGGHALHVSLPQESIAFDGDGTRLTQVFSNLINNAAKYMAHGGNIFVTATATDSDLTIAVRDEGIGIPADMLGRVFDLFVQVDDTREMSQGGLGVGLTLVQRIVEMHGGTVQARSEGHGKGSEFVIRIPLVASGGQRRELRAPAAGTPATAPRRRRILVVDDNTDSAESMSLLLRKLGHEVRSGADGLQAVELAGEFRPDLVLLDLGLPGLNGYEAAVRIRALLGTEVTIVAMTGWGRAEDLRRTREAGFDRHLVKPIDFKELENLLQAS